MDVHLLYADREFKWAREYYDGNSIVDDLGLKNLFHACSRDQERVEGNVQSITEADPFLSDTLKKVMLVPLTSEEQIVYRQQIMQDLFANPQFLKDLYFHCKDLQTRWEVLGRREMDRPGAHGNLVAQVKLLHLFVNALSEVKKLCRAYASKLTSAGMRAFAKEAETQYDSEWEQLARKVMADISFYCDGEEEYSLAGNGTGLVHQAHIVLESDVSNGLKLGNLKLESVETLDKRFKKPKAKRTMMEKMITSFASEPTVILKDPWLIEDLAKLENRVVECVMESFKPFMNECRGFFDELYVQTAFYRAAYNLYVRSLNMKLPLCYPKVCAQDCLRFEELTEFSMATYRASVPVGNSSVIDGRMLLIVTGANQGGKSTFLRSIGVAQVMHQCGMFVSARKFESGIFPQFFTHFTRREDSAMNSGRLDEELKRIDGIIRHLGPRSMVLLNESFATTTEEEGSLIAYDIIRALAEAGVRVLSVTHLLSFAKQIYGEARSDTAFLHAERKENGVRTFKMVPGEPELTSFGLDLYEQLIEPVTT